MRIKRGKHYKRIMRFYQLNYAFSQPFKVMIDGNFLMQCVKAQQDAKEMLSRVLGGICVFREIESLKDKIAPGTYEAAKVLRREDCNHKKGTSAPQCIAEMLGAENEGKYLLATQDEALKERVRKIPGVPVAGYYKESKFTEDIDQHDDLMTLLEQVREENRQKDQAEYEAMLHSKEANKFREVSNRKRHAKGPNPLSVKKRKAGQEGGEEEVLQKRRNRRKPKAKLEQSS